MSFQLFFIHKQKNFFSSFSISWWQREKTYENIFFAFSPLSLSVSCITSKMKLFVSFFRLALKPNINVALDVCAVEPFTSKCWISPMSQSSGGNFLNSQPCRRLTNQLTWCVSSLLSLSA